MAPVEVDIIPRSIIAPIKDSKTVEKALTLPIVSDACNEVARYAEPITPYVETTYEKLSPMVELGYKTVLAKYEDSLVPWPSPSTPTTQPPRSMSRLLRRKWISWPVAV